MKKKIFCSRTSRRLRIHPDLRPRRTSSLFALLLRIPPPHGKLAPPVDTIRNLVLGKINGVDSARPIDISYRRDHKKDESTRTLTPVAARKPPALAASQRTATQYETQGTSRSCRVARNAGTTYDWFTLM